MSSKKVNKATFSYGGEKMSLTKSKTAAAVQYLPGAKKTAKRGAAQPAEQVENFEMVRAKRGIDGKLDEMRNRPDVMMGTHVWHVDDEDDATFIPTGNLYLEFLPKSTAQQQETLLTEFHLNVVEVVATGAYRVSVTPQSPNPVKCAMLLQKNKLVRVAEPEFVTKPSERDFAPPSGRFIATQWHLENTGQSIPVIDAPNSVYGSNQFRRGADAKVREAWMYLQSLGSKSLNIAVIDTGFATEHPQLRGDGTKIRNAFNASTRANDVSPWAQMPDGSWGVYSHGTSCAAVAMGAWDTNGILGAAPNARFMPIKLDVLSDEAIKNAFEHALLNGADIISCSLGYPKPVPLSTYVFNYLRKVATEGRGGRGVPMFFAAGNANPASNWQPRLVSDFAAHPDGICITASNSLDQPSSYSFYGPQAFLSAPSNGDQGVGITTATVELGAGGNTLQLGYTSGFGGTSSAAPLAAGVCALMLTANPNLTLADIKDILRRSADKIAGGYDANGHSDRLGYGRINALKAVQLADARQAGSGAITPPATGTGTGSPMSGGSAGVDGNTPALRGRVVSPTLNVRSGPATSFAKVGQLKQGDVVNLLENKGGWWRIGAGQFVSGDYIQVLNSVPTTRRGKVTNSFVNVRSGPSVSFAKVGELKQGAVVSILESTPDGWLRVGTGQWVLGKYVQVV